MGYYGITGWSRGARTPLTYNMRAGQMRGMGRLNVFPSRTYINNNFYGSSYSDSCSCNSNSTPGWMNWMMGIGMFGNMLGGILGMFAKKDTPTEGAGEQPKSTTTTTTQEPSKLEQAQNTIKSLGEGFSVKADADGNITYEFDDGTNKFSGKSLGELMKNITTARNSKPTTPTTTPTGTTTTSEPQEGELEDGSFSSAIDEKLGTSSQIKGRVSVNPDTRAVNIQDVTNTYTYTKGTRTIEYKGQTYTVYSLTGATNNKTGKAVPTTKQEYILINGQLVQPKDCKGLKGLGTGSIKKGS